MTEPLVFLNGKMLPASQAKLNIFDLGIVLGATVTEMTRTFRKQPYRVEDHVDRLFRSLRYTRMEIGLTRDQVLSATRELIAHNTSLIPDDEEIGVVHFVTPGEQPMYAGAAAGTARTTPTVCIHSFPLPFEFWASKLDTGVHVVTPSIRHVPPQCYDPKMKYRSRMHYYLADKEAQVGDPAAIALLLDLDGNVTETSGANFLMVEQGKIISPTLRNTLPGISRATVIDLAAKLGIPFIERDIQVFNVVNADEAFLSSTPYCLLPVTKINGVTIADGKPGPILKKLQSAWSDLVGLDIPKQIREVAAHRTSKK
ncbi:MAG: aminotransferase class IV [Planctomycetaceae bacterium]